MDNELEKRFKEKFDGIYYGKDDNGPIYPSETFKEDVLAFFASELKELRAEVEKQKGNGKVLSGSPSPMFDWGCSQGYDSAINQAIALINKRIGL